MFKENKKMNFIKRILEYKIFRLIYLDNKAFNIKLFKFVMLCFIFILTKRQIQC